MSQNGQTHFKNLAQMAPKNLLILNPPPPPPHPILTLITSTSIPLSPCHEPKTGNPANIFLFTVNNRDTRKGVNYVQSLQ